MMEEKTCETEANQILPLHPGRPLVSLASSLPNTLEDEGSIHANVFSASFPLEIQDQLNIDSTFITKTPITEDTTDNCFTVYPNLTFINDNIVCDKPIDLNDIQLYLECSDDSEHLASSAIIESCTKAGSGHSGTSYLKSDIRFKVSFPVFPDEKQKGYSCCFCKNYFSCEDVLRFHVIKEHKEVHMCPCCPYNTKSRKFFNKHIQAKHRESNSSLNENIETNQETANHTQIDIGLRDYTENILQECDSQPNTNELQAKKFGLIEAPVSLEDSMPEERNSNFIPTSLETINFKKLEENNTRRENYTSKHKHRDVNPRNVVTEEVSAVKVQCTNNYVCRLCSFSTTSKKLLKMHGRGMHDPDRITYSCTECSYKCKQKHSYIAHTKLHSLSYDFVCYVCSKCFLSKSALTRHMKTHSSDRKYMCDFEFCNKAFKTKGALSDHRRKVHSMLTHTVIKERESTVNLSFDCGLNPFKPSDSAYEKCSKHGFSEDNLSKIPINKLSADEFSPEESGTKNMRDKSTWTGVDLDQNCVYSAREKRICKPFRAVKLSSVVTRDRNEKITIKRLKRNRVSHIEKIKMCYPFHQQNAKNKGSNSFQCPIAGCCKTFRDNFNLKNHLCIHKGVKKLSCNLCDYKCIQRTSLSNHMKHKH